MREKVRDVERLHHMLEAINVLIDYKNHHALEDAKSDPIVYYPINKANYRAINPTRRGRTQKNLKRYNWGLFDYFFHVHHFCITPLEASVNRKHCDMCECMPDWLCKDNNKFLNSKTIT